MTRNFGVWMDRAFWYLLCGVIGLGVESLRSMADSVAELNTKIAVVIDQVGHQGDELREHSARLHDIETRLTKEK